MKEPSLITSFIVVVVGSALTLLVIRMTKEPTYPEVVRVRVSAYCPCQKCCGRFADGITASGHVLKEGELIVAAPPEIPFGATVMVPGYGRATVEDRGGAIKDGCLDVFFWNHIDAIKWGVQYLDVVFEEN